MRAGGAQSWQYRDYWIERRIAVNIAENVALVRRRMTEAARAAGRDPEKIRLVAATKMNDASRVREAVPDA